MSFKSVQKGIAAKEGIPMKNAGAILANASRNASPAAKKKNPKLNRVKGKPKGKLPFKEGSPRDRSDDMRTGAPEGSKGDRGV